MNLTLEVRAMPDIDNVDYSVRVNGAFISVDSIEGVVEYVERLLKAHGQSTVIMNQAIRDVPKFAVIEPKKEQAE